MIHLAITILLATTVSASAVDCARVPDRTPGPTWRYRVVDGERCWYRGDAVLAKSELQWRTESEVVQVGSVGRKPRPEENPIVTPPASDAATTGAGEHRAMTFAAPLKPTPVRTVSYPVEQPTRGDVATRVIGVWIIAAAFGLAVAGMMWPVRRRSA